MKDSKCTICRRAGTKLFLKGEKCLSPKCLFIRKSYPPGQKKKGKKRFSVLSEFGKELKEKQKLKNWYNLNERQFRKYIREIFKKRKKVENTAELLVQKLEDRFDNVIFRLGLADSRAQARQFIGHGHFFINMKKVRSPSYQLKKNDKITINPASRANKNFENLTVSLKKHQTPSWLRINAGELSGEVMGVPTLEEAAPPVEISSIFEYYSR